MPDHLHFIVRLDPESRLADYVRLLKQTLTRGMQAEGIVEQDAPLWQHGFFDRLLRSSERHSSAWEYMLSNPLDAGLAAVPTDWPFQGEVEPIRF